MYGTTALTPAQTTLSVVQQNNERFRGEIPALLLIVVEWLGLLLVVVCCFVSACFGRSGRWE